MAKRTTLMMMMMTMLMVQMTASQTDALSIGSGVEEWEALVSDMRVRVPDFGDEEIDEIPPTPIPGMSPIQFVDVSEGM